MDNSKPADSRQESKPSPIVNATTGEERLATLSGIPVREEPTKEVVSDEHVEEVESNEGDETQSKSDTEKKDDKQKVKKSAQDRIMDLAHKRRDAEKAAADAKRENDELRARIRALEAVAPAQAVEEKPKRINFSSEDDYIEALTDWKTKKVLQEKEESRQRAAQEAAVQELSNQYQKTVELAKAKYDDFAEVVNNSRIAIPNYLGMAIQDSQVGGEITYYLAKHEDEIKRLLDMTPIKAVKYITQLEKDLLADDEDEEVAEVPKTKSNAKKPLPEPINPGKGLTPVATSTSSSFEEYRARRKAEQRR